MTSNNSKKENVALSSVGASLAMTGGKLVVGLMTGSMGILSEAAHSLLDMFAAVITYLAVRVSGRPADDEHHYGYGKIEAFSALIETMLLFVTSGWIIYEAGKRLMTGDIEVEATWYAFAAVIVSILIDYSRSRALMKVAKETKSQALEADALHFRSDIWSSAVVFLGLLCVLFGIKGADSIAALGVAVFVVKVGYHLGKRTFDVLIDAAPEGIAGTVKDLLKNTRGVIEIERVRVRALGPMESIEATIHVSRKLNGEIVRDISERAEKAIRDQFPAADIMIHTKAIQLSSETLIEAIRILAERENLSVHDIIVDTLEGKKYVSYDLEVSGMLTVGEAHNVATAFEELILKEVGDDAEINTHIDPSDTAAVQSASVSEDEIKKIAALVHASMSDLSNLKNIHNILARRISGKIIVSLHCDADANILLEEAHASAKILEHRILEKDANIKRAVVHVEPE